ncbi:MAG: hypothetical protein KJ583_05625 [Nanoarchaeota archaeon]|nr:hypothetical protein [Nanoarchaeota archaeon]MBU1269529.1 hypothetical protein [Nanoarchaeota archaeon]MBU1604770.1 hypothetical protein [Nanoarchaeota archaeon]MBU2442908.1 hypothetical protein [Nanoarchaeota archaeon]
MAKNIILSEAELSKYIGQWVVISDNKVVAHDKRLNNLSDNIKNCKRAPIVAKVPKKETWIF